jgi:membrane protease YdiL (CAAX protease family)
MMVIPRHSPRRRVVLFFLLAYGITWIVWIPRALNPGGFFDSGFGAILGLVWSYGPALAAMATILITAGRSGLRELGARLETWRVGWVWYAVAILGPLALAALTGLVNMAAGGTFSAALSDIFEGGIVTVFLVLAVLCLTDGLGEETGWRGYALPRLLEFTGAVGASLVLGLVWASWHLPLFWTDGTSLHESSILVLFLRLPATSLLFTWLYQRTQGSLLLAVIFHAALNLFTAPPTAGSTPVVAWIAVAVQWAAALALVPQVRRQHARSQIITTAALTDPPAVDGSIT